MQASPSQRPAVLTLESIGILLLMLAGLAAGSWIAQLSAIPPLVGGIIGALITGVFGSTATSYWHSIQAGTPMPPLDVLNAFLTNLEARIGLIVEQRVISNIAQPDTTPPTPSVSVSVGGAPVIVSPPATDPDNEAERNE